MGEETRVPDGARPTGGGRRGVPKTELARTRLSKEKRRVFLNHLAATCNVKQAAAAAGPGASYFYNLRRVDAEFAAGWEAAVQASYDRIEEALVAHAIKQVGANQFDAGAVTLELVDGDEDAGADALPADALPADAVPADAALVTMPVAAAATIARVDVRLALAMLARRAAMERKGRERHSRRRPTAAEVEKALNDKLDKLARRITPLGGNDG